MERQKIENVCFLCTANNTFLICFESVYFNNSTVMTPSKYSHLLLYRTRIGTKI